MVFERAPGENCYEEDFPNIIIRYGVYRATKSCAEELDPLSFRGRSKLAIQRS